MSIVFSLTSCFLTPPVLPRFILKYTTSSFNIITTTQMFEYKPLNPVSIAHMCKCLGLTTLVLDKLSGTGPFLKAEPPFLRSRSLSVALHLREAPCEISPTHVSQLTGGSGKVLFK